MLITLEKLGLGTGLINMGYLIDTDILIEISRGNAKAISFFESMADVKISVISASELVVGARDKNEIKEIPDAFIATTAIIKNLILATKNTKHFKKIKGLEIKEPDY